MADYLPHTEDDVASMLAFLGMNSLDDLFAHIPASVRLAQGLALDDGLSEPDVAAIFAGYTDANKAKATAMTCYAGGGAYDHEVPAVVKALASRSEFVTAYTPYQPEVAQGVLQALFEYQTLISRLSGLAIPNASLYDAATALVEALNMAHGATGRTKMVISSGIHPHWRQVARTFAKGTGYEIVEVALLDGVTDWSSVDASGVAAVVAAYPNYLGVLEDLSKAKALAVASGALFVVGADPVAAGVLKTAGQWGADVFVGEGQAFGTPLSFGGPYLGLFACTEAQVRRLPGRIVGETVDSSDRRAFVTTLRAREQDIRREKATSNVCTNQTLMAVTAAIQLGWLGTYGLREVATRCAQGAHYLFEEVLRINGIEAVSSQPFFREFAIRLPRSANDVIASMAERHVLAGLSVGALSEGDDPSIESGIDRVLLVSVTERRTKDELDHYVKALREVISS
ncbi:MAG TPA: aminomethyl-transferring glycine dehydrogenase subunit GcvPA [Acidimicrobiales bacterium]|nr:aminomethyl-transferring glycine dehydrogenase subunit GcvPA [Acidimicrobiales bacterium]